MKLFDARTFYRYRTQMLPKKLNMKSSEKLPNLREAKNIADDGDLIFYFQQVFKIREQFEEKMKC